jgi:hypothetical protein
MRPTAKANRSSDAASAEQMLVDVFELQDAPSLELVPNA